MLMDLQRSMVASAVPGAYPRCFPYVAGSGTCDELNASQATSDRASEPWRTYSEALLSGAIDDVTTTELLAYHQSVPRTGGSRLKLGILSGNGGDAEGGGSLMTFTSHGWGWGLLQADLIEPFLLQFFSLSAHAYTRGTFTAPESAMLDRTKINVPFATPAGVSTPLMLKWLLLCEHPVSHSLWIAKATPRNWLAEGEQLGAEATPSAYGRFSFRFRSEIDSAKRVHVNVTVPSSWTKADARKPGGGLVVRLRTPHQNTTIAAAEMGGGVKLAFNVSEETVRIPQEVLCCKACACEAGACCVSNELMAQLQSVVVSFH